MERILVWDWPVRVGHWLLVAAFAVAWLTSESEQWRLVHAYAGGAAIGVVLFRLVWGVTGTRHARFADFVRGPGAVIRYLSGLARRSAPHAAGHNAAGGWAIVALLAAVLLTGATGWLAYQDFPWAGGLFEELHEACAATALAVAAVHVAGVLVGSLAHGENLVRAMLTGRKRGDPGEAIVSARPAAVVVLLGAAAACAWWFAR